jgi:fused signal recognition particle receptor
VLKGLFKRVGAVLRGRSVIDDDMLEELEEALIQGDVSVKLAMKLVSDVREQAEKKKITDPMELTGLLRKKIEQLLRPLEAPLNTGPIAPTTMLVIGVNGVGKTTSIAKIAHWYKAAGNNVMIVAGDTFRAAAIEQLKVWAERIGCDIVAQQQGADPAAAVYDGLQAAGPRRTNLMVIDTAGRLHTKHNLMEELRKIDRVITRELGRPADEKLLVIDGTTGQNALNQAREFNEAIGITGLMITKLDGTAKGGILLTIADELKIPVKLIGLGEKPENLGLFSAKEFAAGLFEE